MHFENNRFVGRTSFSRSILRDAIVAATERVSGVAKVRPDFRFMLRNLFRRGRSRGVVIRNVGYGVIVVDICVVIYSGYASSDIAYRVQEAALAIVSAQKLTEKSIRRIDVKICDVAKPLETKNVKKANKQEVAGVRA